MAANDGKQRSGATEQPGGAKGPGSTAVPNYPKTNKNGGGSIPTPTFPTGNTARSGGGGGVKSSGDGE